jgi:hypothetical protein
MRAQAHLINLARPLVGKIRLNHVVREDIALEEELMVSLKRVQCLSLLKTPKSQESIEFSAPQS